MLTVVAISDTHCHHEEIQVPDGDVLVHTGDFSRSGTVEEMRRFAEWFEKQPHQHKICIAGNHDWACQKKVTSALKAFANVNYLFESEVEIDGIRFWGAPWQPEFYDWAFNVPRGEEIAKKWAKIPSGIDVLLTHGPPYGHGDFVPHDRRVVGCFELLKRIKQVQPRVHIFGHIHEGYGVSVSAEIPSTTFINASTCNGAYEPVNKPISFKIRSRSKM